MIDFKYYKLTIAHAHKYNEWIFKILDKTNCQRLFLAVRVNEIILLFISSHWIAFIVEGYKAKEISFCFFFFLDVNWILWDFDFLMFGRKSKILSWRISCLWCASDEAFGFFEAFHALLSFLVSLLDGLNGLHFQVSGVSPLDTHFALILLFIMTIIVYSIAYAEIKLQPLDVGLPILRFICLVSGIIAIELLVAMIVSPFWLFMVNLCPILIIRVLHHS